MTEPTSQVDRLDGVDEVDEVDDVVRSLDGLEGRPVEEHPEVFERAHDALRSALAGDGSA